MLIRRMPDRHLCPASGRKPAIDTLNKIRAVQFARRIDRAAEIAAKEVREKLFKNFSEDGKQAILREMSIAWRKAIR